MRKRVLDAGQCGPDHFAISRMLTEHFDVEIVRAHVESEVVQLLSDSTFDLVLVNRKLDADYSDGMQVIRRILCDELFGNTPVMLVSNYPEYQDQAVEAGALYGFGKAELGAEDVLERLAAVLG